MLRASDFADASWPFCCWPRKAGRAIAARMPMIRITTRSSMSVKPFSSPLIRWESFRSIGYSSLEPVVCQNPVQPPRRRQLGRLRRMSLPPEPRSFASPPRGGFAFSTAVLTFRPLYRLLSPQPERLPRRWTRDIPGTTKGGHVSCPPLGEGNSGPRTCYQVPPALQPPLFALSQPRLVVPSAAFVMVKCVPDFDSADTV